MDSAPLLSRFRRGRREIEDLLADPVVVVQVLPTAAELHDDSSRRFDHTKQRLLRSNDQVSAATL
jgi:hypothetical protein